MTVEEIILELQSLKNGKLKIRLTVPGDEPYTLQQYDIAGLMQPCDQFKDWSIIGCEPSGRGAIAMMSLASSLQK